MNLDQIKARCLVDTSGCWLWQGAVGGSRSPRPQVRINWKCWYVSRYVWFLTKGIIPEGLFICHYCDKPLCVNPSCLYVADQKTNMRDASKRGRFPNKKAITAELVQEVRCLRLLGDTTKVIAEKTKLPMSTVGHIINNTRHN